MRLVMATEYLANKLDDKTALRLVKEAGFDGADYSMYYMKDDENVLSSPQYREYAKALKAYADDIGIPICQTHAPFPAYKAGDEVFNSKMPQRVKRSIEIAALLGAPHIVVHPIYQSPTDEDEFTFNIRFFKELKPLAAEYGVKIAIENTFGYDPKRDRIIPTVCSFADELHRYLDALDDENFIVCFDTGHSALVGVEPEEAIRALGCERLKALHVHDNNYLGDYHRLPYTGKTDWNEQELNWNEITKALAEIDYSGDFTFETDEKPLAGFDEELYPTVLRFMHDVGRFLIEKIDRCKI